MDRVNNYLEGISTKDCVMTCNDTYSFQNRIKTIDSVLPIGDKRSFWDKGKQVDILPLEVIASIAPRLMLWYQDPNWPGAEFVEKRLNELPNDILMEAYRQGCEKAREEQDTEWLFNLQDAFRDYNFD